MNQVPVMLYDGDCAFCARWIRNWQAVTGDKVLYFTYQKALKDYPQVKEADCQKSVQLIFPDGKTFRGAHAVFLALALSGKYRGLLWSYEHLPLFAPLTEAVYRLIARNRSFFSRFI